MNDDKSKKGILLKHYIAALALCLLFTMKLAGETAFGGTAHAQDNKWRVDVKAVSGEGVAAENVAEKADEMIKEIAGYVGHEPSGPYVIYVTPDREKFKMYAGAGVPEWAVAVYTDRKIVISPRGVLADRMTFMNTLHHELVHAVLDHKFRRRPGVLPRWLNEGLAVVISDSWEIPQLWPDRKTMLYASLKQGRAYDFADIGRGFPRGEIMAEQAYAQSADFVQYLVRGRKGWARMRGFLDGMAGGSPMEDAFREAYGKSFDDAVAAWEADVEKPGGRVWLMHILVNFDMYLWIVIVLLLVVGFTIVIYRRRRPGQPSGYDPDDDWDDLDEEWDTDLYGFRPWRPKDRN